MSFFLHVFHAEHPCLPVGHEAERYLHDSDHARLRRAVHRLRIEGTYHEQNKVNRRQAPHRNLFLGAEGIEGVDSTGRFVH